MCQECGCSKPSSTAEQEARVVLDDPLELMALMVASGIDPYTGLRMEVDENGHTHGC